MQSGQDWQTRDGGLLDRDKSSGYYHSANDGQVDPAGNRLDSDQHQITSASWHAYAGHESSMPALLGNMHPMSATFIDGGHAGPSNYAMYDNTHNQQAYTAPSYEGTTTSGHHDLTTPRLTGHFSQTPKGDAIEAAPLAVGAGPSSRSRPKPYPAPTTTNRTYSNGHNGSSLKRGMACGFCRKRKLKCDAERPTCANCIKYKKECEYLPQPKVPDEEDSNDQGLDSQFNPVSAPIYGTGDLSRTASQTTFGDGLVTPSPSQSTYFNHSFPPRFGPDVMLQSQLTALPMGPPGFSGSPDGVGPQTYMSGGHNFPFTVQPSQSTPHSLSTPLADCSSAVAPDPFSQTYTPTQFAQYGAMGLPSWSQFETSPGYGIQPPLPNASNNTPNAILHQPLAETVDIKPLVTSPDAIPTYSYPDPSEFYRQPPEHTHPNANGRTRQSTLPAVDSLRSLRSTPDPAEPPPPSMMVNPNAPYTYTIPPPTHNVLYISGDDVPELTIDPMDGLTARLGEFLFAPSEPPSVPKVSGQKQDVHAKRRKQSISSERRDSMSPSLSLVKERTESDGLTNAARDQLLSIFLAHSRLFLEMSIPRFKYRMTFNDRRRPSLALLNAMYLWASRIAAAPGKSPLEEAFFVAGCRTLEAQTSRADRLVDGMRAAMLLSAYAYTNGRYHEGFLLAGVAARLVLSSGVHQIPSCSFGPPAPRNALLRQKAFLLPPPEDKLDLAERIHTFWAVFMIERCGSLTTGFPSALRDEDIITPFPRPMVDIASGNVTSCDDVTVRDLYRFSMIGVEDDSKLLKWLKALIIIERASKLAFLDPTDDSEYAKAMSAHVMSHPSAVAPPPPAWMEQPKYRCPGEYRTVKLGLDQFVQSMGIEGIFPIDRKRNAQIDGAAEPFISSHAIYMHHILAAISMFLHDINSIECENAEALAAARKSVSLFRYLPPVPVSDIDSFVVIIWGMVARTLLKEMHRLRILGDMAGASTVEEEADVFTRELKRVGETMSTSRTQAMGLEAMKAMDSSTFVLNERSP